MSDLPAIVSPEGEVVPLFTAQDLLRSRGIENVTEADLEQLAGFMDEVNQHVRSILNEAVSEVSDELVRRMDKRSKWTLEVDGLKVTAPSPDAGTVSYDALRLNDALYDLVEEGVLDEEALRSAVGWTQPKPEVKAKQAGVNRLLKLGGEVKEAIEACRVEVEPPVRRAKVQRVKP